VARERGRLAGGAEHVETVAAAGEQETRERDRARAVGLTATVDGGGDRGDHAVKLAAGHVASDSDDRGRTTKKREAIASRPSSAYIECGERSHVDELGVIGRERNHLHRTVQ